MGAHSGALNERVGESLRALADGKWSAWNGLLVFPAEDVVEQALGPSVESSAHSGMLGGSPTLFRRYPSAAGAPRGVVVWFEDDSAVTVEIEGAVQANGDILDEPEATLDSEFGPNWRQEVYASRGLVLHRRGDDVALLYGLRPFTVDDWKSDPLRHSGPPTRR